MANIPKSGGNFVLNVTNTTQTYIDTLYTDNKVVSGDIEISITAKTGTASVTAQTLNSETTTLSGTTLTVQAVVTPSVSAGYINSGNSGVITIKGNVPVETKTITPSASTQTITPTSGKLISSVVVEAVPGVETETKTVKSTLATATVTPTAGKYINQVIVSPIVLEAKSVTPTTATQTITFDSDIYDGLSEVVVYPAPPSETTELTVSAAGTFTPSAPYVGFNKVTVGAGSISVTSTSATTSLGVTPGSVSVANRDAAITGKTQLTVTPTTTAASVSTDYYVAVRPTAAAGSYYTLTPSTYTITADVTNAGYVDDTNDTTITISAYGRIRSNSKTGSTYYLPIPTTITTVTASTSAQTITPPAGYLISKVNVNALTVYDGSYDS